MNPHLKESVIHGTQDYPFAIYSFHNYAHPFHVAWHWHDEIEILFIKQGTLHLSIYDKEYIGKAGDIFWINPRQIHQMKTTDTSTCYYAFVFHPKAISFQTMDMLEHDIFSPLCEGFLLLENKIPDRIKKELSVSIQKILIYNKKKDMLYQLNTKIELLHILSILLKSGTTKHLPADSQLDQQKAILQFLNLHYGDKLSLSILAEQFHMSEKYFSRYFKQHFQMNFTNYLNMLRMEKASELLLKTNLSITEIALQTGYPNISYFNRIFQQAFGCSPKNYRKNNRYEPPSF